MANILNTIELVPSFIINKGQFFREVQNILNKKYSEEVGLSATYSVSTRSFRFYLQFSGYDFKSQSQIEARIKNVEKFLEELFQKIFKDKTLSVQSEINRFYKPYSQSDKTIEVTYNIYSRNAQFISR